MAYVSKQWKDRLVEYPNRRTITHDDLTQEVVSVNRNEGTIYEAGDVLDSVNMNNLESRIAAGLNEKQNTLTAGQGITIENDIISATGGGGGASALVDLTDTEISSPTDKQALVYDATSQKWKNGDSSGFALDKVANGSVVSFNDGADDLPVVDLTAQIVPKQSGTGDPSPSNVRPISGFTGVNVTRTGKNFFNPSTVFSEVGSYLCAMNITPNAVCNISFIDKDTSVSLSGIYFGFVNSNYSGGTLPSDGYRWCIENGVVQTTKINTRQGNILTGLVAYPKNQTTIDTILARYNIQIEIGESATEYVPFIAKNDYSVTWQTEAGTVYGGSIDLTTGVLTVTHGLVTLDGQESWSYSTSGGQARVYSNISDAVHENTNDIMSNIIKPVASAGGSYPPVNEGYVNMNGYITIGVDPSTITSADAWKTFLASQNMQLVYPLATPQTYQLTPKEVKTLLGNNTIFADTGNVSVDYQTEQASNIIELVGEGGASDLADLDDVDLTTPTDGQVLKYNGTSGKWENGTGGGGGASDLDDLGDVTITSPTNGQFLSYNSSSQKWRNVNAPEKYVTYNKMAYGNSVTISDAVVGRNAIELSMDFMATQESIPTSQPSSILPVQELRALLTWDSPETAQTLIAQFSNQYYGGYYDFVSGILKVTKDAMNITTCTMHNTYTSFFAKALTDTRFYSDPSKYHLCDEYILVDGTDMTISLLQNRCIMVWYGEWNGTTRWWIVWRDDSYTTNSAMTTHLSQVGGINLVGDLVTPVITSEGSQNIPLKTAGLTITSVSGYGNGSIIRLAYESSNSTTIIDYVQASTGLAELNDTQIASPTTGQVIIYNSTAGKWQNAEVPKPWVDITGTLVAGNTTLTLSDSAILTTSTIEVAVWDSDEKPTAIAVQTGSVTLTFDAQQSNLNVKVRVS